MSRVGKIVDIINDNLISGQFSTNKFKPANIKCIAELYKKDDNGVEKTIPGVIDFVGNIDYVGMDDKYKFQIYHRILNSEFDDNEEESFGNMKRVHHTHNMIMVVMYDITKVKEHKEEIIAGIGDAWTYQLTTAQLTTLSLNNVKINGGTFSVNSDEVFESEFKTSKRKSNWVFISFTYTIEEFNRQGCFSIC